MAARFSSVEGVALEFFDEFAEFGRETVHGTLEARQEVERHDDGEADRRDGRQEILFHLVSSSQMAGALAGRGWRWDRKRKEWQGGSKGMALYASGEFLFVYRAHDGFLEGRGQGAFDDEGFLGDDAVGPFLSFFARQVLARVEERDGFCLGVVESKCDFKGTFHGKGLLSGDWLFRR